MLITVIVIAYNRTSFILEAIDSVARRKDSLEIEVYVIKNFIDPDIDKRIDSLGYYNIYSLQLTIGAKISEVILKCHGSIVSFLEDDDLFFPNKIEAVYEAFKKDDALAYFHNSYLYIDKYGEKIKPGPKLGPLTLSGMSSLSDILIYGLVSQSFFHNLSSLSVKKDLLMEVMDLLPKINTTADFFVFCVTLYSHRKMFFSDAIYTKLRVHSSYSSRKLTSIDELLVRRSVFVSWEHDLDVMLHIFDFGIVRNLVLTKLQETRLRIKIIEQNTDLHAYAREILTSRKSTLISRKNTVLTVFIFLSLLLPTKLVLYIYYLSVRVTSTIKSY